MSIVFSGEEHGAEAAMVPGDEAPHPGELQGEDPRQCEESGHGARQEPRRR